MTKIIRIAMLAGSVATLAACNVIQPEAFVQAPIDATAAKNVPDQGTAFQKSLHQGYADFGRYEYQQSDFRDTKYFNDKARASAAGQNVQPVVLSTRDLSPALEADLVNGRERLMRVVGNAETIARVPGPAGAAQVYFDCWAEQAEEGHQPIDIAYCKQGFETAMSQVTPAPVAQAPAAPMVQAQTARPYIVFFDWDKSSLAASSDTTMNELAAQIKRTNPTSIKISGHADKSGTNVYNDALSMRRADVVRASLERNGVTRSKSSIESFGESKPLVNTADDVREPQNRRVEVTMQ
jgi:outer membrane protein OmpA-like peptidoglycan-associated protein